MREVYKRGELIELNDVYLVRRKLVELILLSFRKVFVDRELVSYGRNGRDYYYYYYYDVYISGKEYINFSENVRGKGVKE